MLTRYNFGRHFSKRNGTRYVTRIDEGKTLREYPLSLCILTNASLTSLLDELNLLSIYA